MLCLLSMIAISCGDAFKVFLCVCDRPLWLTPNQKKNCIRNHPKIKPFQNSLSFGLPIKFSNVEIWAKDMKQKMTLLEIDWRTSGEDTWNVIKNHSNLMKTKMRTWWEHQNSKTLRPHHPILPKRKQPCLFECILSLLISCMKFLFLKLFVCCHFQLGWIGYPILNRWALIEREEGPKHTQNNFHVLHFFLFSTSSVQFLVVSHNFCWLCVSRDLWWLPIVMQFSFGLRHMVGYRLPQVSMSCELSPLR